MSNYKNKVLELVQQRPGVRSVQISDLVDLDMDIVESILAQAVREGVIQVDEVVGANRLPAKTYSWAGVAPQGLDKQEVTIAVKPEMQQHVHTAPAAAPTAPTETKAAPVAAASTTSTENQAQPVADRSKASVALDYLVVNGPTDRATLMTVMGLPNKSAIEQYLKPHVKSGKIVRIDDVYCIPDRRPAPPAAVTSVHHPLCDRKRPSLCDACIAESKTKAEPDSVRAPTNRAAGGMEVIDILRSKLSPEEFHGFLKGSAIQHLLGAEHKGGAQDYKMARVYSTWLAESAVARAS
jgi:hypothetical protein